MPTVSTTQVICLRKTDTQTSSYCPYSLHAPQGTNRGHDLEGVETKIGGTVESDGRCSWDVPMEEPDITEALGYECTEV